MNISLDFKVTNKEVKCIAKYNGIRFIHTRRIERQADRVDGLKRAKQLAYCGVMNKIHGYVCKNINHLEVLTNNKLERRICNGEK